PHGLLSADRSACKGWLRQRSGGRRHLRGALARIPEVSEDQRAHLSVSRPTGLLVDLRSRYGDQSEVLQAARREHGRSQSVGAQQRWRDPLGVWLAARSRARQAGGIQRVDGLRQTLPNDHWWHIHNT